MLVTFFNNFDIEWPMKKATLYIVDDNDSFLELFVNLPGGEDFEIIPFDSADKVLERLREQAPDLIISDVQMPGMSGVELFNKVQDTHPDIPFILITAWGSIEEATGAVRKGAFHYFEKPINDLNLDLFWTTVREALEKRTMLREISSLRKEKSLRSEATSPIIGRSSEIEEVLQSVEMVANLPVTVLIQGETGVGKELVARAIHQMSDRRNRSFFAVNCTEFAAGVLESELFGHEKGAFTGAVDRKRGLFEIADKGTLFLDEISDAPDFLQPKLLRVLENRSFKRVGGSLTITSDFRLLAATNRNLEQEVAKGNFRQDLLYRVNVYSIEIPPLRERRDDIHLIAEYYLERFVRAYGRSIDGFSDSALLALRSYEYPGNIRELVNIIERAVITCKESKITTSCLPFSMEATPRVSGLNLKEMEKFYIELGLKRADGNKTKAADLLGLSRKTLIQKVRKYGLDDTEEI